MASYTSEDEALRDALVAFNILISAARNMVAKLIGGSPTPITTSTVVPEIANFQRLFTENRGIVFKQIGWMTNGQFKPASLASELEKKGLTADGRYGSRTSTALALTMWAQSENPALLADIGNSVPSSPVHFTQYYLKAKELFDETLRDIPIPQGVVQPPPVPAPQPPQQVIDAANQAGVNVVAPAATMPPVSTPANGPTQVVQFEDHAVVGQGKGRFSFGVVLASLLGLGALGGITFYILRKKRMI